MATDKNQDKQMDFEMQKQFYEVFEKVIATEKATRQQEFENKITFQVKRAATKSVLKILIEKEFGKTVKKINTVNNITGHKRAIITFLNDSDVQEIVGKFEV
jgi:ribosomal protein L23